MLDRGFTGKQITIVAQHFPGDQSTYYTSPWAGGNFSCISPDDEKTLEYDKFTYTQIELMQQRLGGRDCGIDKLPITEYWDFKPSDRKVKSIQQYLENFAVIPKKELPAGAEFGVSYITWNFNCPLLLNNLKTYLCSLGVKFERRHLKHISQGFSSTNVKVVFNCSGLGARSLGGIEDSTVYPVRGQVVIINAPHIRQNKVRWGSDYATYIIPRPNSGGQVVLGGLIQKHNWIGDTFACDTQDILRRATDLLPDILKLPLEILRESTGLRPYRKAGVRIEKEKTKNGIIIHNYGAGGYGYQSGYGMANAATGLLVPNISKL